MRRVIKDLHARNRISFRRSSPKRGCAWRNRDAPLSPHGRGLRLTAKYGEDDESDQTMHGTSRR